MPTRFFADVVEVARHGTENDLAAADGAFRGQGGLQNGDAGLHGLGGNEHLRDKDLALAERLAHAAHSLDHALVEDDVGVDALLQGLLDQAGNDLSLALLYVQGQLLQNRHLLILLIMNDYKAALSRAWPISSSRGRTGPCGRR